MIYRGFLSPNQGIPGVRNRHLAALLRQTLHSPSQDRQAAAAYCVGCRGDGHWEWEDGEGGLLADIYTQVELCERMKTIMRDVEGAQRSFTRDRF